MSNPPVVPFWIRLAGAVAILTLLGCVIPGKGVNDKSLGHNGSFEIVESDLPVNWIVSKYPAEKGDAEFLLDTTDAIDGAQSLKIVVHRIGEGQWGTPFLFQVRELEPAQSYTDEFWLKNRACKVLLEIGYEGKYHMFGGPSDEEIKDYAAHPPIKQVLGEDELGEDEWRQFQYVYTTPETDGTIRFELELMQPGTLWIDDVRVAKVESDADPES